MKTTDGLGIVMVVSLCSVLILIATAALEKYLLKTSVYKRLDEFSAKIKEETDRALRQYEGSIHQKNVVNLELAHRKGEVFQCLYKYIAGIIKLGACYHNTIHVMDLYSRNRDILAAFDEMADFFDENGILFTEKLYDEVNEFFHKHEEQITFLRTNSRPAKGSKEMDALKIEKGKEVWAKLEPAFKRLMGTARREYNSLYYDAEASNSVWVK